MYTRSGRSRASLAETNPSRTRKTASPPRSPARTRKSSPPPRSPSRKSPSRKSPSRKPSSKYPARKSPSRITKETESAQKSPNKRHAIRELNVHLEHMSSNIIDSFPKRPLRAHLAMKDVPSSIDQTDYSVSDRVNGIESLFTSPDFHQQRQTENVTPRRSSRLRDVAESVPDIRRSLSKSLSKSGSKSLDKYTEKYSDEETQDYKKEKSQSVTRKLSTPLRESISNYANLRGKWEFGGPLGTLLLIFFIPLLAFFIITTCSKSCKLNVLSDTDYKSLSMWLSTRAFAIITAQYIFQGILTYLPILGTSADPEDNQNKKYYFNAFFSAIATTTLLVALDSLKILKTDSIMNEYVRLAVVSYIYAVILSVIMYAKSRHADIKMLNQYGNTGFTLHDFCMGREIHPYFKSLNVKIWISRICNINTLILAGILFKQGLHFDTKEIHNLSLENYQQALTKVELNPSLLLYCLMQISYALYFIMREYKITSTFYWQSEGVGYLQIVSSALYPFYIMTISKFVADTKLILPTNILITASIIYALGFFIMLASNNTKYEFRKNPLQPSLSYLDSMPTFHGKKLIVSGIWGTLRHPNYTGDILIHTALALPGIISRSWLVCVPAATTVIVLCHRASRDHVRCARRYGAAWQRYCKRVPSVFIPKVL